MYRRVLLAVLLTPMLAAAPTASAEATPAVRPATGLPSVLTAGHYLVATQFGDGLHHELASPSGVFALRVTGMSVEIDEDHQLPGGASVGTINWWHFRFPGRVIRTDKSKLRMQRDGNLVLYTSKGKAIWASHTRGTGHHNSLHLQNDGNLVIYNAKGKAVWSSRTTPTIMTTGHSLASGKLLVNRYRQQFGVIPTFLIMRRNGDLVLTWNGQVTWSSRTHVRGAHAVLTSRGRLAVETPSGRVLWRSPAFGRDAWLELNQCGQMALQNASRMMQLPPGPARTCG